MARGVVSCPQCGVAVRWAPASRYRPFCSERCKMIDLGAWASDAYRVPAGEAPDAEASELPEHASGGGPGGRS
jgi:endogenous inhibitor of DNA gyrase (YacG/DUF329 family)